MVVLLWSSVKAKVGSELHQSLFGGFKLNYYFPFPYSCFPPTLKIVHPPVFPSFIFWSVFKTKLCRSESDQLCILSGLKPGGKERKKRSQMAKCSCFSWLHAKLITLSIEYIQCTTPVWSILL